jgi:hypothetical protein
VDHELGMADHGALRRAARAFGLLYHRPALDLSRGAGSEGARRRTAREKEPFWQMVALGTTHCGAGCALGDILAKCGLAVFPLTLFGQKIFAAWAVDYVLALGFGIFFQYFTIAPMRGLGFRDGIKAAFKADTLSLTAWQVGMYGWMAIAVFVIFRHELSKTDPIFWLMMQIAMLAGFLTSYPVNWWLLRAGIKEKM